METIYFTLLKKGIAEDTQLLGSEERLIYDRLRFPNRRHAWWLGRMATRQLLGVIHPEWWQGIQVLNDPGGAPYAVHKTMGYLPGCLSISHRQEWATAAWCGWANVGIDLEYVEPRMVGFGEEYYSRMENEWLAHLAEEKASAAINVVWSLKEAVLKAMKIGLRMDTRDIQVISIGTIGAGTAWEEAEILAPVRLRAWWQMQDNYVLSLAVIWGMDDPDPIHLLEV